MNTRICLSKRYFAERYATRTSLAKGESYAPQDSTFPGLLRLVDAYLETLDATPYEKQQIDKYLNLIRRRANGA